MTMHEAGLAAVTPTLVPTLLDWRWADLGPILQILCGFAIFSPVTVAHQLWWPPRGGRGRSR